MFIHYYVYLYIIVRNSIKGGSIRNMNTNLELISLIDCLAVNTWPAENTEVLGPWLLRASSGITKRANSVFTLHDFPAESDWLERIETFYRERYLPVCFQVSDASPAGLEEMLDQLGYEKQVPCLLMTADAENVKKLSNEYASRKKTFVTALWHLSAEERWVERFLQFESYPMERKSFYTGLLNRIEPVKGCLELQMDGVTVAVATAVAENGWAGFVNVVVREDCRGQGLGYHLMHTLAQWSQDQGANHLYLQVIADNEGAARLYKNVGFTPLYGYHYRIKS
jgi:GNAT superfamily N-acetyltransferase